MRFNTLAATLAASVLTFVGALAFAAPQTSSTQAASANQAGYVWRNVVTGGGGGFVDGIVFHPKQKDLIYCRTDIGGVYRWNPKTKLWIPLTDWVGNENGNLRGGESIAVDPTDPNRVYVAAGTYLQTTQKTAILSSDDKGTTWHQCPMPGVEMGGNEDGRNIGERLAVDPNSPNIIYFGSRMAGLWRSDDYAKSFTKVASFPAVTNDTPPPPGQWHAPTHAGIGFVVFDPKSAVPGHESKTIYAAVDVVDMPDQLYRSTDSGSSWSAVPGQPTGMYPQHAAFDKAGVLYIDYASALGPNGASNGAVWKYDTTTDIWANISPEKALGLTQVGGYGGLAVDYNDAGIVDVATLDHWGPSDDVYRTTDGGKSWVAVAANAIMIPTGAPWLNWGNPKPKFGWWLAALAMDPFNPGRVLYGTGATIWGTEDIASAESGQSTTWVCYGNGIEETAVTALAVPSSGPTLISGLGDIGGFVHNDLTVSPPQGMFANPGFGSTSSLDVAADAPNVVVRAGANNDHQWGAYSTDSGTTWQPFASLPPGAGGPGSLAVTADGKTILWRPQHTGLYYTTDLGATWNASAGLSAPGGSDSDYFGQGSINVITDRVDFKIVYVTGVPNEGLLVSSDSGHSFSPVAEAGLPNSGDKFLTPSFAAGSDIWMACSSSGLYHSTNAGATFTKIASISDADGFALGKAAPGSTAPTLYLVGTPTGATIHGVYRSTEGGATWLRINDDQHQYGWIGRPLAADLRVFGRVYLGTNGRGIVYGEPAN